MKKSFNKVIVLTMLFLIVSSFNLFLGNKTLATESTLHERINETEAIASPPELPEGVQRSFDGLISPGNTVICEHQSDIMKDSDGNIIPLNSVYAIEWNMGSDFNCMENGNRKYL